jgi:integral membrane protein (TIGR01906 family)
LTGGVQRQTIPVIRATQDAMKLAARIATVLFVLAVPVFLITSNVRFVAGESWFYKHGFRDYHVDQTTGVSYSQLDASADDIVRYFEDDRSSLHIQVTIDGQDASLYNDKETAHMKDVKTLMRLVFRLNEASLAIILAYVGGVVLWSRERSPRDAAKYALYGVGAGFVVVAVIGAFALTGFDAAWTKFHEIAFRNDLWELDPRTDRLIQMFPEPFWKDMTFLVGGLTLVQVFTIVAASLAYVFTTRKKQVTAQT